MDVPVFPAAGILPRPSPCAVPVSYTHLLDLTGQREFYAMIKELKKQGKTIILILHELSQAVRISDTLVVMNRAGSRSLDEAAHAGTDSDVNATDFPGSIAMVRCV